MCNFTRKASASIEPVIDSIICSSKLVLEEEGLINFRVGRIISEANCSSKTFYRVYESKSDLLLCLWIRCSVSNFLVELDDKKTELTMLELMLLPIVFTLSMREKNPIASRAISASVNSSIWSRVESSKSVKVKNRVNFFWSWVRYYALKLQQSENLNGNKEDVYGLCDKLSYLLRGFIMVNDTEMVLDKSRDCGASSFIKIVASEFAVFGVNSETIYKAFESCETMIAGLQTGRKGVVNCSRCESLDNTLNQFHFDECN